LNINTLLFLAFPRDGLAFRLPCRQGADNRCPKNEKRGVISLSRLTKRALEAIAPVSRPTIIYDSDLKGFGVRVMPSGSKAWIVEFRPNGGGRKVATKRMTLGRTATLHADEARKAAREILAAVRLGQDPARERTLSREKPIVREFAERYLSEEAESKLKPGTVANYRIYFRKHVVPAIGALKINTVSSTDVAKLHRKIGVAKPITANRVVEAVSSLYRYAAIAGVVENGFSPTIGISAFREVKRERFLSTDELQRLGATLRVAETVGLPWNTGETNRAAKPKSEKRLVAFSPYVTAAIRLLLFTGCRLREILHLRWKEVDFEQGMLFLPDSKTGRRTVVLNAPALAVLSELKRIGDYVVLGEKPERPRSDLKRPWSRITIHAKLEGLRIHDLRHSFASIGAGGGLGLPIVGKLLGHETPATTARYAHIDNDPLRRASERIGATIASALGETSVRDADIVRLRK
jgi:integrase